MAVYALLMKVDDELRRLITAKREALGWSGAQLAAKAGTSQQNVQRVEAGDVKYSRVIPAILKALDIKPSLGAVSSSVPGSTELIFGAELVGDRDFPVYAAAAGGAGQMLITSDPVEFVKRPDRLIGVPRGYGLIIAGDSMQPAFWHGDIALVHPHLSLRSNVDVVLYRGQDGDGDREAIIKRLLRETHTQWKLKQWNPPPGEEDEFSLEKADWPICHYVVGRYAGR